MNSNTKYLIAMTVAVILVAGALTLPLAFDEHSADAKKKSKKYSKTTKKTKQASIEAEGGNGGTSTGRAGGNGTGGNGGSSIGGNG